MSSLETVPLESVLSGKLPSGKCPPGKCPPWKKSSLENFLSGQCLENVLTPEIS